MKSFSPALVRWHGYQHGWLHEDVMAGITAAAVIIPQAMAYAAIAGLHLTAGLYTAIIPLVVYALVGTSHRLSVTTTSTIAILTASALRQIDPLPEGEELFVATTTLACLVGAILLVAGLLRLGVVASLISEPVLAGFKSGIGLVIAVDQIPKLLGLHFGKGPFFHNITAIISSLPKLSLATAVFAATLLVLQFTVQRFSPRAPAALVTVAIGILASALLGLDQYRVDLVGEVQGGLPTLCLPRLSLCRLLWAPALGIALMSFVETVAAGRAFRGPEESRSYPNRELFALGLTNVMGSLLRTMPSGGGTSQTAVNSKAGAHSQLAGLATAVVGLAVLVCFAPVVHLLPQAALATVVIIAAVGMIHPREFRAIWRIRGMEFSWAVTALAGVIVLGTLRGILVAVILSLFALIYHANRRPVFVLGRKPGTDVFRPRTDEHPEDESFPGLLMLKTEGIIHFANAQRIGDVMWRLVEDQKPRVVVIDCSAIPDLEYTALKMLTEAEKKLEQIGTTLWLAGLNPQPLQLIQRTVLGQTLGRSRMHFNLEQAVKVYLRQFGERDAGQMLP